jgi:hypothetical protein
MEDWHDPSRPSLTSGFLAIGRAAGILLPLGLAFLLRGRAAWVIGVAAMWAIVLAGLARHAARYAIAGTMAGTGAIPIPARPFWPQVGLYGWCALGSVALGFWGLSEARRERINLGVAGFALTVVFFYFSSIMDKLGRSASLIGLGILFLLGGWALERTRRRLIARLEAGRL